MSNEKDERDHIVVQINIKSVRFVKPENPNSVSGQVARTLSASGKVRQVGDLLQVAVTGRTVEDARKRAKAMMDVIDDESPVTNLKHDAMREGKD